MSIFNNHNPVIGEFLINTNSKNFVNGDGPLDQFINGSHATYPDKFDYQAEDFPIVDLVLAIKGNDILKILKDNQKRTPFKIKF